MREITKLPFTSSLEGQSSDETENCDICESQEFKTRNSLIPHVVTSQLEMGCQVFCLLPRQTGGSQAVY